MIPKPSQPPLMVKAGLFSQLKCDLSAGLLVFLMALPLCLGVSLASGVPLFAGIISGMIGGIVVGLLSGSQINKNKKSLFSEA